MSETILIIGAGGQIGTELTELLRKYYGHDNVITSDVRDDINDSNFEKIDATNYEELLKVVKKRKITQIYHLAAILSARGEQNPLWAWDINMKGLLNVLEIARLNKVKKVFFPSSIAVFGIEYDRELTRQDALLIPETVYGISKAVGENWCNYYFKKYGLDVRSIRYPGIIGYKSMPGGGTTDYAVDIYHQAVLGNDFNCFLDKDTMLPMMYMDDALRATIELMEASSDSLSLRTGYNIAGISFTPEQVTQSIQRVYPDFKVNYEPDYRQGIADLWPKRIDDSRARKDWGWEPAFDLDAMTDDMITQLKLKYNK